MAHRIFLAWLIYLVVVVLTGIGLCVLAVPQLALAGDHSHLTAMLLAMYVASELLAARAAWRLSAEHGVARAASLWLDDAVLADMHAMPDGSLALSGSHGERHLVPPSATAHHLSGLRDKSRGGNRVDQAILLDVLEDRLHAPVATVEFIAGRVVWVGILATILGVIMAFWPLLSAGMAVEVIRLKLGGFFAGVAVAFIPTAASFVFKIALDFSARILNGGILETVNLLARAGETKVLPALEAQGRLVGAA